MKTAIRRLLILMLIVSGHTLKAQVTITFVLDLSYEVPYNDTDQVVMVAEFDGHGAVMNGVPLSDTSFVYLVPDPFNGEYNGDWRNIWKAEIQFFTPSDSVMLIRNWTNNSMMGAGPEYVGAPCGISKQTGQYRTIVIPDHDMTVNYCWNQCFQCNGEPPYIQSPNEIFSLVYFDENNNQVKENSEHGVQYIPVELLTNGVASETGVTGNNGFSWFHTNGGEKTVSLQLPDYLTTVAAMQSFNLDGDSGHFHSLEFPVTFGADHNDLKIYGSSGPMVAGFPSLFVLKVFNSGHAVNDVAVNLQLPEGFVFSSASVDPEVISGNSFSWTIPAIAPFEYESIVIYFDIPPPPAFMPEDSVIWSANVALADGETNISDNSFNYILSIFSSFDPNDKTMMNGKTLTPASANSGNPFTYQIRFQNTGNFPASFIHVRDTLENGFDFSTFKTLDASHNYSVTIEDGRYIDWFFPEIMLPDSTSDEPGSHGYVLFSVNPVLPLFNGTQLENTAHIYFDYNPAVVTNTEITAIEVPEGISHISSNSVSVLNSVASGTIYLKGKTNELNSIRLFSISGQLIKLWNGYNSGLDVVDVPEGMYLLECLSGKGKSVCKVFVGK